MPCSVCKQKGHNKVTCQTQVTQVEEQVIENPKQLDKDEIKNFRKFLQGILRYEFCKIGKEEYSDLHKEYLRYHKYDVKDIPSVRIVLQKKCNLEKCPCQQVIKSKYDFDDYKKAFKFYIILPEKYNYVNERLLHNILKKIELKSNNIDNMSKHYITYYITNLTLY